MSSLPSDSSALYLAKQFLRESGTFILEGVIALVVVIIFAWNRPSPTSTAATSITVSLASLTIGGLLGFVFRCVIM